MLTCSLQETLQILKTAANFAALYHFFGPVPFPAVRAFFINFQLVICRDVKGCQLCAIKLRLWQLLAQQYYHQHPPTFAT